MFIFAFGNQFQTRRGGTRKRLKKRVMKTEWLNEVEKINGGNRYWISICHEIFNEPKKMWLDGKVIEDATEYYQVHYSWKNAKRSMFNLVLKSTATLAASQKLMEKKIKELEDKIK